MRTIGAWLLAAATILFSVIIARQVGESRLPHKILDIRSYPEWFGNAVGVAVGVAAVLVAMTAGAAGDSRPVAPRDGHELPKAGIAARLEARVVDLLVVAPGLFVVLRYIGRVLDAVLSCVITWTYCVPDPVPLFGPAEVVAFAWVVLYEPVSVALWGRTAGKWAAGIKVVSTAQGARPSVARSFARVALPATAGLATLGAGWLVMQTLLWFSTVANDDRRGWHDRLAGTVVVKAKCRPLAQTDNQSCDGGENAHILGSTGDDDLDGGDGSDTLHGGPGEDRGLGGLGGGGLDGGNGVELPLWRGRH